MGIFDLFKKVLSPGKSSNAQNISFTETIDGKTRKIKVQDNTNNDVFLTDYEHLTKDGELPWGWHTNNKDIIEKISREYSHFLNIWLDSRNKSPKEQYAALKSFVLYLDDVERLCKSKGECFEFWFTEILTAPDYVEQRKKELIYLANNID